MTFNVQEARKAGYSDSEIADYLKQQNPKFDMDAAKQAGYSDSEIVDHLNEVKPFPAAARIPLQVVQGAAKGLAAIEGLPGNAASFSDRYISSPVARMAYGLKPDWGGPAYGKVPFLNSAQMVDGVTFPQLAPQNQFERYLDAGSGALPFGLVSGPMSLARSAVGAFGSGVGTAAAVNNKPDWMPEWAAAALGGLAGQKAGLYASGGVERGINAAQGNLNPQAQAYKDAGITPRVAGLASDSPLANYFTNQAAKTSFGSGRLRQAINDSVNDFGTAVKNIATGFGSAKTYQNAGSFLQQKGRDWLDNFKNTQKNMWNNVDNEIGGNTPVTTSTTESFLNSLAQKAPGNPDAQAFLTSPLMEKFNNIMGGVKGSTYIPSSIDPLTGLIKFSSGSAARPLEWQTIRALKSRVGEYLQDPNAIADAGGAQAKQLYASLAQDMRNTITDPKKLALFDEANAFSSNGHDFLGEHLSPLIADGVAPEAAATKIMNTVKNGGTSMQAIRDNLPDVADQLGGLQLNDAAAATAASQNAAGNAVSPKTFVADMSKVSPEAYQAMYPNAGPVNALRDVGEGLAGTDSLMKSTAKHGSELGFFGKPAIAYEVGERSGVPMAGPILGGLTAGKSLIDSFLSPQLATNPWFVKWASGAAPAAANSAQSGAQLFGGSFGSLSPQ